LRPVEALVASIVGLPCSPRTLASAPAMAPDGTAMTGGRGCAPPATTVRVVSPAGVNDDGCRFPRRATKS
jgi:hypothetical protein